MTMHPLPRVDPATTQAAAVPPTAAPLPGPSAPTPAGGRAPDALGSSGSPSRVAAALRHLTAAVVLWLALALGLGLPGVAHAQSVSNPPEDPFAEVVVWDLPTLPDGWVRFDGPAFQILGPQEDAELLLHLSRHGAEALPRLASELGVAIGGDVTVVLADTAERFRTLQPGNPPSWADATAYPNVGAIFLRNPRLRGASTHSLTQVLEHEMIHVLLGRAFAPEPTPRWLQEGVAQVYSGEAGPDTTRQLSQGLVGRDPLSLSSLSYGFPADAHRASLAYAQSADFILWLRAEYGDDAVRRLVAEQRQGHSLRGAILRITGETLDTIDARWQARLSAQTPVWLTQTNLDLLLLGGAGVLLMFGGVARRRAFRQRMADWEEEEARLERLAREVARRRALERWAARWSGGFGSGSAGSSGPLGPGGSGGPGGPGGPDEPPSQARRGQAVAPPPALSGEACTGGPCASCA